MHCFFKFLERVNPRINSLTFKTENTKTLTCNFSSLIERKPDSDIKLIFLWHFSSSIFHSCPFLIRIYIQQHLTNVVYHERFVRSLVTRHLIRRWCTGNEYKTHQRFLNAKKKFIFTHKLFVFYYNRRMYSSNLNVKFSKYLRSHRSPHHQNFRRSDQ